MNNDTILTINNLNFKIADKNILNNISLKIEKGDFISIIGPNGSGKTSFLKNCLSLYKVKPNTIFINGKDLVSYDNLELSKTIAYIPQDTIIDYNLSVEEIVLMGRIPYLDFFEDYSNKDYEIAKKAMLDMNIYHLKDSNIMNLSGGERQKVFIAKALCQQAELIFLDEPVSELDISNQLNTMKLLNTLNKTHNITIISVLHDINLALNFSKKIIILKNGNLIAFETPKNIIELNLVNSTFDINVSFLENNNKYFISF